MINVVLVGAGVHASVHHGPALKHYVEQKPGRIRLLAVCDLDEGKARTAREKFGFEKAMTSVDALFMPGAERVDALVAVFPPAIMTRVTPGLFARQLPILVEKPLGDCLADAERLWKAAHETGMTERVMVSFNRRHDPGLVRAMDWLKDQPPFRFVRAAMYRNQRKEPDFIWGTSIHVIDALQWMAGPLEFVAGGTICPGRTGPDGWRLSRLRGRHGCDVVFECIPHAGEWEESFRVCGDGYQVDVHTGNLPPWRVRAVRNMETVLDAQSPTGEPGFVSSGAYDETRVFLDAVVEGRSIPTGSLADAMESSRLAARIVEG